MIDALIHQFTRAYASVVPTGRGAFFVARWARRFSKHPHGLHEHQPWKGARMNLDLSAYPDYGMAFGLFEIDVHRAIRATLRPGGWFVDCGANVGYFTLAAARCVGNNGRIDSVEPDAVNHARLLEHVRVNALTHVVRPHAVALGDSPGELVLYRPENAGANHGMASTHAGLLPGAKGHVVPVRRLDDLITAGTPDLIKVDIEGAELSALRGAERLLSAEKPPSLIVEHNPETAAAAGFTPGDIMRFVQRVQPRYRVYWLGWRRREIKSPDALDRTTRQGNIFFCVT